MTSSGDRRPIAARELAASTAIAAWLVRREASPNAISVFGMLAGIAAGLALAGTASLPGAARWLWLLAALLIGLRLAANMFDGMVAIGRGIASRLGELYNEVPDRISDTAVLVGLGWAAGSDPLAGFAAALAAMAAAYIRAVLRVAGAPSDFGGPMAKQQRMALCIALAIWCGLTPPSWQSIAGHGLALWVLLAIAVLSLWTALARLLRGAARLRGTAP